MKPIVERIAQFSKRPLGIFLLWAIVWTGLGLISAIPDIMESGTTKILSLLWNWWVWGLMTPFISAFNDRLTFPNEQIGKRCVVLLLCGIFVIVPIYVAIASTSEYLLGLNDWAPLSHPIWLVNWYVWGGLLIYFMIVCGLLAYKYYLSTLSNGLKMEQLKRHYLEAQMNALRMQLNPHFLFNTLNTISAQVEYAPLQAREMIGHLGDLLRLSLLSKNQQFVTLEEELEFLDPYLEIQRIRFADRLRIDLQIAPEVLRIQVPCLLLQPLVENAIQHGLAPRAAGGTVTICAERHDSQLEIRIEDDGVGFPASWQLENDSGIGLSTTSQRIAGLYPDGGFAVRARHGGGAQVVITLPIRTTSDRDE